MKEKFKVTGMSCAACSARVEKAVSRLSGVSACSVNLLTGDMTVEGSATAENIEAAVIAAGYGIATEKSVKKENAKRSGKDDELPKLLARLISSLLLLAVLMYFSMGHMIGLPLPKALDNAIIIGLIQLLLSAAVMIINQRFFINGFRGLVHFAPNMDTLVSLGSLASFGYSVAQLFLMVYSVTGGESDGYSYLHGLYFESAAMILALITLGKMLEARAKGKTTSALEGLINLSAKRATLLVDGEEKEIPAEDVKVGDVFIVRPGEKIATDAEVISGESAVDESALSGESIPADKNEGSKVYGGTINISGLLVCRAEKVGEGTVLSSIIKMVSEASASKAPIAKLADKVSGVFVPAVLLVALLTFIGWLAVGEQIGYAIGRAISVLVISCPCALGLATPVAIMVGSGVGAGRGVLFKTATALEECGRVKTVILDKTGTVTKGSPSVTDVIPADGIEHRELLSIAMSLEKYSEHPLGRAVYEYTSSVDAAELSVCEFASLAGRGVSGKINGETAYAVSYSYAKEIASLGNEVEESFNRLSSEGKTPLIFLSGGRYIGMMGVADTLKDDALEGVALMKSMGLRVVMLTGDNERTAASVARSVGIDEVTAGVLPDGKETVVRTLMQEGKVAMVGDGINDAPALTRADVGIAIGAGTDIAIDSADVVLMGSGVRDIANAIGIGRATLANIRENLFWAFIYNSIGIPLAIGLFGLTLEPMFGALAMSLSSFCVVMNALRLYLWKPKRMRKNKKIRRSEIAVTEINNIKEKEEMKKIFKVEGMMCPHCEARVKKVVEEIDGVTEASASHSTGEVAVTMTKEIEAGVIEKAITDAGYIVK